MSMFIMPSALAALAAPHLLEFQRFLQLKLDIPSAFAHPLLSRDPRSGRVPLVVKREERVVAVVERPDSRIWDRHGSNGLQLGADDIVAEVVELCIIS